MAAEWFAKIEGQERGPYSVEQLRQLVAKGKITRQSEIKKGDSAWVPASRIAGLLDGLAVAAPLASAAQPQPLKQAADAPARSPPAAAKPPARPAAAPPPLRSLPVGNVVSQPPSMPEFPVTGSVLPRPSAPPLSPAKSLAILVGGGVAVLALVGTLLFLIFRGPPEPVVKKPEVAKAGDKETPEGAAASATDDKASVAEAEKNPPAKKTMAIVEPLKLASSVKTWRSRAVSVGLKDQFTVKLGGVWLAADTSLSAPAGKAEKKGKGTDDYLVVEVFISNTSSDRSLTYSGWNTLGNGVEALLFDEKDQYSKPVPATGEKVEARITEPVNLAPGKSISDTLVFSLPKSTPEKWRLVLPASAFGFEKTTFGYELASNSISHGAPQGADPPSAIVDAGKAPGLTAGVNGKQMPILENPAVADSKAMPGEKRDQDVEESSEGGRAGLREILAGSGDEKEMPDQPKAGKDKMKEDRKKAK